MEEEREVAGGGAPAEAEADPHRELCRILNLPEDAAPGVVSAALRGLAERAESGDALRRELASLRTSAEEKRREELIESGCREGKLSTGQLEWARTLDSAALEAYLDHAPRVVPVERLVPGGRPEPGDPVLTAEDRAAMRRWNFTENEYRKMKEK